MSIIMKETSKLTLISFQGYSLFNREQIEDCSHLLSVVSNPYFSNILPQLSSIYIEGRQESVLKIEWTIYIPRQFL